jgi:hypothetical protein
VWHVKCKDNESLAMYLILLTVADRGQIGPLVREGAPQRQDCNFQTESNIWSKVPEWARGRVCSLQCNRCWSGQWQLITTLYRLIWDCVPFLSPLTRRSDYGGNILTRLHTGFGRSCVSSAAFIAAMHPVPAISIAAMRPEHGGLPIDNATAHSLRKRPFSGPTEHSRVW